MKLPRAHLFMAVGLIVAALAVSAPAFGQGPKKNRSDVIDFKSADGVKIAGRYYRPKMSGKRVPVVLLLHDFDRKKGGSSKGLGYQDLAATLQDAGYAVVSFDFRGFGDSTTVDDRFWNTRNNVSLIKGGIKKPKTISYSQFSTRYFPYLINDIAAARAYIERRNDAGDLNCSNIILLGVGEGATLGAAWLFNECIRRPDKSGIEKKFPGILMPPLPRNTNGDPMSKDIACAVWVSLSPTVVGQRYTGHLPRWCVEANKNQHIPMAFLNGKGDKDSLSRTVSAQLLTRLKPVGKAPKGKGDDSLELTRKKVLDFNLAGEKLLVKDTCSAISSYLRFALADRKGKEWIERDSAKVRYLYTRMGKDIPYGVAKPSEQEVPFVNLTFLFNPR